MSTSIFIKGNIQDNYNRIQRMLDLDRKKTILLPDEKAIVFNTSRSRDLRISSARYYTHTLFGKTYTYIKYFHHYSGGRAEAFTYPKHTPGRKFIMAELNQFYTNEEVKLITETMQNRHNKAPSISLEQAQNLGDIIITSLSGNIELPTFGRLEQKTLEDIYFDLKARGDIIGAIHIGTKQDEYPRFYLKVKDKVILYTFSLTDHKVELFDVNLETHITKPLVNSVYEYAYLIDTEDVFRLLSKIQEELEHIDHVQAPEIRVHSSPVSKEHLKYIRESLLAHNAPRYILALQKNDSKLKEVYYCTKLEDGSTILNKQSILPFDCLGKVYMYVIKEVYTMLDTTPFVSKVWNLYDRLAAGVILTHNPHTLLNPNIIESVKPPTASIKRIASYMDCVILTDELGYTKSHQFIRHFSQMDKEVCLCASKYFPSLMIKSKGNLIIFKFLRENKSDKNSKIMSQVALYSKTGENLQKLQASIFQVPFIIDPKEVLAYLEEKGYKLNI